MGLMVGNGSQPTIPQPKGSHHDRTHQQHHPGPRAHGNHGALRGCDRPSHAQSCKAMGALHVSSWYA